MVGVWYTTDKQGGLPALELVKLQVFCNLFHLVDLSTKADLYTCQTTCTLTFVQPSVTYTDIIFNIPGIGRDAESITV